MEFTEQQKNDLKEGTGELRQVSEDCFWMLFNNIPSWWNIYCKRPAILEVKYVDEGDQIQVLCDGLAPKTKNPLRQGFAFPFSHLGMTWEEIQKQMAAYEQYLRATQAVAAGHKTLEKIKAYMGAVNAGSKPILEGTGPTEAEVRDPSEKIPQLA